MGENGLSAADIAAVTDKNNYGYPYPVYPYGGFGGGFGNSGFGGDSSWIWLILILALFGRIQWKRKRRLWRRFQQRLCLAIKRTKRNYAKYQ